MSSDSDLKEDAGPAALARSTQDLIVPELIEAIRQEGAHVDVNVLLVNLVNKTDDPDVIVANSEKMLAIAQRYEEARVENFKRMADAIIDVKSRDPDELDKRRNNRMRRCLKGIVGSSALVGLVGGVAGIIVGGNIVVVGVLLAGGCIALAMAGPLATGESMSSNDVVRIVGALRMVLPGRGGEGGAEKKKESAGPTQRQPVKRTGR